MIVFRTLSWKNFLSTGNQPTEIRLDKSPTTLILGHNGSGKSTMLDALCYALFKKPFRKIKKDQIINTINNKACEVEVTFEVGTHEYKVRRGIKPDYFEVYIDGEIRNQNAARKDDQQFLEEDVLKVNYDSFTQVVILGNAKYTPFMQLKTPERREFIEHILDIGVFSSMNEALKVRVGALKEETATNMTNLALAQEQIDMVDGFIEKLRIEQEKATAETEQQIQEQNAIIAATEPEIASLTTAIEKATERVNTVTKKINDDVNKTVKALEAARFSANTEVFEASGKETGVLETKLKKDVAALRQTQEEQTNKIDTALEADIDAQNAQIVDTTAIEAASRKLEVNKGGIINNIASAKTKIEFYSNTTQCKTCKQAIAPEFRDGIVVEETAKLEKYENGLVLLEQRLQELTDSLIDAKATNKAVQDATRRLNLEASKQKAAVGTKIQDEIAAITETVQTSVRQINAAAQEKVKAIDLKAKADIDAAKKLGETAIKEQTAEDKEAITEKSTTLQRKRTALSTARSLLKKLEADMQKTPGNLQEQIDKREQLIEKYTKLDHERDELVKRKHYYEVCSILLKDTGIKAAIIKQYLPMINKLVNKYLSDLDFFVSFSLDENFEETFKSRHRDTLQYTSFSEGEKLRIDLALLLAWRDIARMKNSCSTNLLILDEVIDSSLDHNGTDLFIKMLNDFGASSNVFVISHKNDAALDKFKDVIRFEKTKNFSHLVETL